MPYQTEVSRKNPSCFVFLIDQSGSMNEPLAGIDNGVSKAVAVADAVNNLLQNIVIKCTKAEGIRDYYYIAAIGYGGNGIHSALPAKLSQADLMPVGVIGNTPLRVEQQIKRIANPRGGHIERPYNKPIWVEPVAGGGTPFCAALDKAAKILREWLKVHPDCFPPLVMNISDGESSDGDPKKAATALTSLYSSDGQVLLFNIHLSSYTQRRAVYPYCLEQLDDDYSKDLFQISSNLTQYMQNVLAGEGHKIRANSRGLAVHADFSTLMHFLDIGTRPANLV
jgi:hypothetical protein